VPQCEILGRMPSIPAEELGGLARGMLSVVAQLWDGNKGIEGHSSIDVVLECISSASMNVAGLSKTQRCVGKRVIVKQPWTVGPRQQPQAFKQLMPGFAPLPWEHLFEIAWEPPCLFLRKPAPDAPLMVNGAPVRQSTFVLLHNVEIAILDPATGSADHPLLAFRLFREAFRDSAGGGDVGEGNQGVPSARDSSRSQAKATEYRPPLPSPDGRRRTTQW